MNLPAESVFPRSVPATELEPAAPVDYMWQPFIAPKYRTLITSLWKCGKTTLLSYILQAMAHSGGNIGGQIKPAGVLVISEEHPNIWYHRHQELTYSENIAFMCRPFAVRPNLDTWIAFSRHVACECRDLGHKVVIYDSLPNLWCCHDENDAASVLEAVAPLNVITEAGAALVLVNHPPKSGGGEQGTASRGSGALPAWADILVELRRFDVKSKTDRRRVLCTYSRLSESIETVIELTGDGYRTLGGTSDAARLGRLRVAAGIMDGQEPMTVKQIRELWTESHKPSAETLRHDLLHAVSRGHAVQTGAGVKNDPHRYCILQFPDTLGLVDEKCGETP